MNSYDDDPTGIHLRYDRARSLSPATIRLWLERIARHVDAETVEVIVDVGCGTGRFTVALAEYFAARVCGVEPSEKMLGVAIEAVAHSSVEFLRGAAEALPLADESADLIFLSMVYHHIEDKTKACREFARVLKRRGRIALRTSTLEQLDAVLWLKFFPAARRIETRRIPSRAALVAHFEQHGFRLETHETVRQRFAENLQEYYEKIALRGLSTLSTLPDSDFDEGLSRLKDYCRLQPDAQHVDEELDLFIFVKNDARED